MEYIAVDIVSRKEQNVINRKANMEREENRSAGAETVTTMENTDWRTEVERTQKNLLG